MSNPVELPEILLDSVRQYRCNRDEDGDEFVYAFDYDETIKVVCSMQSRIGELEKQIVCDRSSGRDWCEDSHMENGNYICKCIDCGEKFIGHKRRVQCKKCAIKAMESNIEELKKENLKYKMENIGLREHVRVARKELSRTIGEEK